MLFRKDDEWIEKLPVPDIRNWPVLDQDGTHVGFVETVVADRQDSAFEAILTGANDRFSADEVGIEDGFIRVAHTLHRRPLDAEEVAESPSRFEDSYRRHFEQGYAGENWNDYLRAYTFGREMAADADFAGRSFANAEEDLRAYYVSRQLQPPYRLVRDAIQHGYSLGLGMRLDDPYGLDQDEKQMRGRSADRNGDVLTTGATMSNLRPPDRES